MPPTTRDPLPAIAGGQIPEWPTVQPGADGDVARDVDGLAGSGASADPEGA